MYQESGSREKANYISTIYLSTLEKDFLNQSQLLTQNINPMPFVLKQPASLGELATSQHLLPLDGKAGHFFFISSGQL